MKKLSNIGAMICFVMVISSYILYSLKFNLSDETLNIVYALTGHTSMIVIALIFFFESSNHVVKFLSIYTAIFFTLAIACFVYIGIIENETYFQYKLCLYLSIIFTLAYEAFSFIRKLTTIHRADISSYMHRIVLYCRLFLQKDKESGKEQFNVKRD